MLTVFLSSHETVIQARIVCGFHRQHPFGCAAVRCLRGCVLIAISSLGARWNCRFHSDAWIDFARRWPVSFSTEEKIRLCRRTFISEENERDCSRLAGTLLRLE